MAGWRVCLCVCDRGRGRKRERESTLESKHSSKKIHEKYQYSNETLSFAQFMDYIGVQSIKRITRKQQFCFVVDGKVNDGEKHCELSHKLYITVLLTSMLKNVYTNQYIQYTRTRKVNIPEKPPRSMAKY